MKLWRINADYSDAECVDTLIGYNGKVYSAFHPTLPILATYKTDNTVLLWDCKGALSSYNNFTLYDNIRALSENICNSLCHLCNFNLCIRNPRNHNNSNGFVVKLSNNTFGPSNDLYIHYSCLHGYLLHGYIDINNISIEIKTLQQLLHIDHKEDALTGSDFYNDA